MLFAPALSDNIEGTFSSVKDYFTLLSKSVDNVPKYLTMRAMRAIVRVMVLGQMTRAKCRAQPTFRGNAGNEGNQFQTLSKIDKI